MVMLVNTMMMMGRGVDSGGDGSGGGGSGNLAANFSLLNNSSLRWLVGWLVSWYVGMLVGISLS